MNERLRKAMIHKGFNATMLAGHLGVSRRAVEHWLNGTRQPNASSIKKLCIVLGISSDWLLGLERKKYGVHLQSR